MLSDTPRPQQQHLLTDQELSSLADTRHKPIVVGVNKNAEAQKEEVSVTKQSIFAKPIIITWINAFRFDENKKDQHSVLKYGDNHYIHIPVSHFTKLKLTKSEQELINKVPQKLTENSHIIKTLKGNAKFDVTLRINGTDYAAKTFGEMDILGETRLYFAKLDIKGSDGSSSLSIAFAYGPAIHTQAVIKSFLSSNKIYEIDVPSLSEKNKQTPTAGLNNRV